MAKIVIGIIAIVILMIMFPMVMSATHDIQTAEQTDVDLALSGTPPAGTCTLSTALWQSDTDSVISGVDDKGNILTIVSYAPATKVLTVGNVNAAATKATIVYEIDGLTAYTGMGALVGLTPLLIWIAILASVLGGMFFAIKGKIAD